MSRAAAVRDLHRRASHGVPPAFPVAQFPNVPLAVALVAAAAGRPVDGRARAVADAVAHLALGAWAFEELTDGVNWFRRALGAGVLAALAVRLAA